MAKIDFKNKVPALQKIKIDDDKLIVEIDFSAQRLRITLQLTYLFGDNTEETFTRNLYVYGSEFDTLIASIFPTVGNLELLSTFKANIVNTLKSNTEKITAI